jgi:CDGSH-type Zn-finger protein
MISDTQPGKTIIKMLPNGPLIVEGDFEILSADNTNMAEGKGKIALCRCGATASKPFCDGSHSKIGFHD